MILKRFEKDGGVAIEDAEAGQYFFRPDLLYR